MTTEVVHGGEPFQSPGTAGRAPRLAVPGDGDFDLVSSYTPVLPNRVTVYLLGFDPADADLLPPGLRD